jgi:hypothetical protein
MIPVLNIMLVAKKLRDFRRPRRRWRWRMESFFFGFQTNLGGLSSGMIGSETQHSRCEDGGYSMESWTDMVDEDFCGVCFACGIFTIV